MVFRFLYGFLTQYAVGAESTCPKNQQIHKSLAIS